MNVYHTVLCFLKESNVQSFIQTNPVSVGEKSVSPAYTDEDKVGHLHPDNEINNTNLEDEESLLE